MKLKPLAALKNINEQRILVRCDFDVPVRNGRISDDSRLRTCLPTVQYLLKNKAKIILIGHLGRPARHVSASIAGGPKGQMLPDLSLLPIKKQLEKLLKRKITLLPIERYLGSHIKEQAKNMKAGDIIMLENLRFSEREELNCRRFGRELASLAKYYINEAFAVSHRAVSSLSAVREFLPGYAGFHLQEEIDQLSVALKKTTPRSTLIIGGAKIETKLPVIKQFIGRADNILVGGAVANDFFKALGYEVGASLIDAEYIKDASTILAKISHSKTKLILPLDVRIGLGRETAVREAHAVSDKEMILDIGPKTARLYQNIIKKSKMIIWNGPLGKFEDQKFAQGTLAVASSLLQSKARILIGGGETGEIINSKLKTQNSKLRKNIFISVGGGAMLDFLAGKKMPGLN